MTQCLLQQQRQSLQHWGRRYFKSKGMDGNCLFCVLSYYFYGTEMMHCKTQTLLLDFVAANSDRFKSIVTGGDVTNHVQKMQHLSVWGTHVELQVPVYMLTIYQIGTSGTVTNHGTHQS